MNPADDLAPEPPGERRMDIALEPLGGAVTPLGALGRQAMRADARAPSRSAQLFQNPRHGPRANLKRRLSV
jgi:hypothetical protein